jgi:hypothetical protein
MPNFQCFGDIAVEVDITLKTRSGNQFGKREVNSHVATQKNLTFGPVSRAVQESSQH